LCAFKKQIGFEEERKVAAEAQQELEAQIVALKHLAQQQAATIGCRDGEISDLKAHVAAQEQVW